MEKYKTIEPQIKTFKIFRIIKFEVHFLVIHQKLFLISEGSLFTSAYLKPQNQSKPEPSADFILLFVAVARKALDSEPGSKSGLEFECLAKQFAPSLNPKIVSKYFSPQDLQKARLLNIFPSKWI